MIDQKEESPRILIQLIDVSHKIFYNDIKAEKQIYTMINAVVSHELRNPLNALLGQMVHIQLIFDALHALITLLQQSPS